MTTATRSGKPRKPATPKKAAPARRRTAKKKPPAAPPHRWEPIRIGPTWQRGADGRFLLPKLTLGWHVTAWAGQYLRRPDGTPWRYTNEQFRLTLWWYAVDELGRFIFRDGVVQRLKGWGKDPLVGTWCAAGFVGPCRFSGELAEPDNPWGVPPGQPLGAQHPEAWVQIAAVSKDQTRNTMTLFPWMFSKAALERYNIDLGKEIIYADKGRARIEAVTSSPRALEGGRSTEVVRNETQHWLLSNEGHEMDAVIDRNVTKSSDGQARACSITNAFMPGEDSVAERARDAYEAIEAGESLATGIMYDSLEAPADAPLTAEAAPEVVTAVRGDSLWLDVPRIVQAILDPRNPPSRSRRFWYNQVTAAEDAWVTPQGVDDPAVMVRERRVLFDGQLTDRFDDDEIVAFFDGSKSDDATGLVGCRVVDGHLFTIGVWQKPPGPAGKGWLSPRGEVDGRVEEMFRRYKVAAFYADPSHAIDDEGERYWDGLIDDWHRRYSRKVNVKLWAVRAGDNRSAFMWDMASHDRQSLFTAAAERYLADLEGKAFTHDGHPLLRQHMKNARRRPNKWGVGLGKENRESAKKVDLAVCAVGARMLHRIVLNLRSSKKQRTGRAQFL